VIVSPAVAALTADWIVEYVHPVGQTVSVAARADPAHAAANVTADTTPSATRLALTTPIDTIAPPVFDRDCAAAAGDRR
jgi:hypothetical protein